MNTLEQARAIARSLGIETERAGELPGGNQNHVVRVSGGGRDVVVRFARDAKSDSFDREAWCLTAAAKAGIRSSRLVARGWLEGLSYLVVDYLPGASPPPSDPDAWQQVGRFAAALARVDVSGAPQSLFTRFGRDLDRAWDAHLSYNLGALAAGDPLVGLGVYRVSDREQLRALLGRLARRALPQGLVHGDLSPRNLVIAESGAVIDWGSAHTGPGSWGDLDVVNRWRMLGDATSPISRAAFARVLKGAGIPPSAAEPVLDELAALHALDIVRWAIDCRPDRLAELARTSARLLRMLLTRPESGPPGPRMRT